MAHNFPFYSMRHIWLLSKHCLEKSNDRRVMASKLLYPFTRFSQWPGWLCLQRSRKAWSGRECRSSKASWEEALQGEAKLPRVRVRKEEISIRCDIEAGENECVNIFHEMEKICSHFRKLLTYIYVQLLVVLRNYLKSRYAILAHPAGIFFAEYCSFEPLYSCVLPCGPLINSENCR